jgi:small subunit ribosomal protein S13
MARISGVDLPRNKRIGIGLTYIFGIGKTSADKIVQAAKVARSVRCDQLTDENITSIRMIIDENYRTEGSLKRLIFRNINRLKDIRSVRGRRHRVGLPVRGQRTRTNARTRKGKFSIAKKN